jgi:hypothetical protein
MVFSIVSIRFKPCQCLDADVNGLKAQLNNLKLSVTEEVTRAFLLVQATGEAIKTSEVYLHQAKGNLSMDEGRYSTGVHNALEIGGPDALCRIAKRPGSVRI